MSKEKENRFENFLESEGYLLVFTLVCAITLLTYFIANRNFSPQGERVVLGTSVLRGVWFSDDETVDCPGLDIPEIDGCITDNYLEKFEVKNTNIFRLDDRGRFAFTDENFNMNASFNIKRKADEDIWEDVYIGDLNLKINKRNWVFEDVVWNRAGEPIFEIYTSDSGYTIIFYPSITLTGLSKQFWVFEYYLDSNTVECIYFIEGEDTRAFVEASDVSIVEYEGDTYFMFKRLDPSLMGNTEISFYRFDDGLRLYKRFLLLSE